MMDTDRNLLAGVLAVQADVIDHQQFVEVCILWSSRKSVPLIDLLVERGWIAESDRVHLEYLVHRKLNRHGGDVRASLAGAPHDLRRSLEAIDDVEIQNSVAGLRSNVRGYLDETLIYAPGAGNRYERSAVHATGGIGRVWRAEDRALGRIVALKELRPDRAANRTVRARFLQEARITSQLQHPGVVPVYEFARGAEDDQPFYIMRFVKGRTLADAIAEYHRRRAAGEGQPFEFAALLGAFVSVCNTVAYAHSRGIIHRDLKGRNVVLGDFGEVILLDWGLAKRTKSPTENPATAGAMAQDSVFAAAPGLPHDFDLELTLEGEAVGTPAYMAPEQAAGDLESIDERTDVYGLGALLYEILTGRAPFTGDTVGEILRKVRDQEPVPPIQYSSDVPAPLERVCLRALAKSADARFGSAVELASEIQHWQESQRLEAVDALRQQTEILNSILQSMADGVVVADVNGHFVLWNAAADRMVGIGDTNAPPDEWSNEYGLFLPDGKTPYPPRELPLARAIQGEEITEVEIFVRNKDNPQGRMISVNGTPLRDARGAICGGVTVFRDITEKNRDEESL